jgi:serine protease Do
VRGWLGVSIQTVDENMAKELKLPSTEGALVSNVFRNSPAEKAGLRDEDFIVEFDGKEINDSNQLMHLIATYKPGVSVAVKLIRDGREKTLTVTLGERSDQVELSAAPSGKPENRLGLEVKTLTEALAREYEIEAGAAGVLVTGVAEGSLAEKGDIQEGDLIQEVNREAVRNARDFNRIVNELKAGETVLLRVIRGENKFFVALKAENE